MNRAVLSLALLEVNLEHLRKDYIDIYVPFVATLICRKKYEEINILDFQKDFFEEFELQISYQAAVTILNRSRNKGIVKKENRKYFAVRDKALELDFSNYAQDQIRKQEYIINEFSDFCKERYNKEISTAKVEQIFYSFLKNKDIELVFAASGIQDLPTTKFSGKHRYLFYDYFKEARKNNPTAFNFIISIAIGHILASALVYDSFEIFNSSLNKVDIYLDTRFVFSLFGLCGPEMEVASNELLSTCKENKAKFFIYRHNYEEITYNLENSINWVENPEYDPSLATQITRHFIANRFSKADVQRLLLNIDSRLKEFPIFIADVPECKEYHRLLLDENNLYNKITDIYKKKDPLFIEEEKKGTILRDIKSILGIYSLRKNCNPSTLNQAGSVFVTTNSTLAYATRRCELEDIKWYYRIPAILTDVWLGTLTWLHSQNRLSKARNIVSKKIIADCYASMRPDETTIKKYVDKVEQLRKDDKINYDEYVVMRCYSGLEYILQEIAKGDPEKITEDVPVEVLERIKNQAKDEGKFEKEQEFLREKLAREEAEKRINAFVEKKAKRWATIIAILCVSLVLLYNFVNWIFDIFGNGVITIWISRMLGILSYIVGVLGLTVFKIYSTLKAKFVSIFSKPFKD